MTREEIFAAIVKERQTQDATWKDRSQYKRAAAHILILEETVKTMREEWYESSREKVILRILKLATVAVRALEEIEP